MLVRRRLTLIGFDHWADANDRRALELHRDKLRYGFVGAMCLTIASETFHHWQIFAQGESGVCVVLDRLALERSLADLPNFIAGPVEYVQLNAINGIDAGDIHRLPFLKRYRFHDLNRAAHAPTAQRVRASTRPSGPHLTEAHHQTQQFPL